MWHARAYCAAGSRYVDVPVRILATATGGRVQCFRGTYTFRRAVVTGATMKQRQWHYGVRVLEERDAAACVPGGAEERAPGVRLPAVQVARGQRQQAILSYWRQLEYFAPFDPTREADERRTIVVSTDSRLPWNDHTFAAKHPPPRRAEGGPRKGRRHGLAYSAYVGCFRISESAQAIRSALGDGTSPIEEPQGDGCFGRLDLNELGQWTGSLVVSTLPWAVGHVLQGRHRSHDWEKEFAVFVERAAATIRLPRHEPCTVQALKDAGRALHELAGWIPQRPARFELVVVWQWQEVREETAPAIAGKPPEAAVDAGPSPEGDSEPPEILNGFFIPDLARIGAQITTSGAGDALGCYLDPPQPLRRVDLLADPHALRRAVSPTRLPDGRWPGSEDRPLNLMQQAAVNLVLNEPSGQSKGDVLFAVNGPPGTGKTTLLRDVIAGLITKRAEALAAIEDPGHAFRKHALPSGGRPASIWEPPAALVGYEIVVASSNNRAVENITTEIPDWNAIAAPYQELLATEGRYFGELADLVGAKTGKGSGRSWGLLAAVLGKRSNRNAFREQFWFGKESITIRSYLKAPLCQLPRDWSEARARFKTAQQRVRMMKEHLAAIEAAAIEAGELRDRLDGIEAEREDLEARRAGLSAEMASVEQSVRRAGERRARWLAELEGLGRTRPGWLAWILDYSGMRQYLRDCRAVRNHLAGAGAEVRRAEDEYAALHQRYQEVALEAEKTSAQMEDTRRSLDRLERRLEAARVLLRVAPNEPLPADPAFWKLPPARRHCTSPWITPELNRARAELFLAALHLHQAFVMGAGPAFRQNLSLLVDLLDRTPLPAGQRGLTRWLWQTRFLIVPVVSTTFASVAQMCRDVAAGELGWLFIDEAGQAVPQAAVGALWRARHAIIVGDPQQLEPIVEIPDSISADLRQGQPFLAEYDPICGHSVQTLADRLAHYGAAVSSDNSGDSQKWIGCPLIVHRRCLDPMFSLANEIAYDNRMVAATLNDGPTTSLPESCWIHAEGPCESKQWVPNQWASVHSLVAPLIERWRSDGKTPSLYVCWLLRFAAIREPSLSLCGTGERVEKAA